MIKQYIPVRPTHSATIKVINHGVTIALGIGPMLVAIFSEVFVGTLGKEQVLGRVRLVNQRKIVVHGLTTGPGFVPVKTYAPSVFSRFWILKNNIGATGNQVTIVIPDNDLLVPKAFSLKNWAQVIFKKIALFFRGVDHRLPTLHGHRLVLDGHPPDWHTFSFIGFDKFGKIHRPSLVVLR